MRSRIVKNKKKKQRKCREDIHLLLDVMCWDQSGTSTVNKSLKIEIR